MIDSSNSVRKLAVFTSARSEYGSFRGLLEKLESDVRFDPLLIVTGSHLSEKDGKTIEEIKSDGFVRITEVPILEGGSTSVEFCHALGIELSGLAVVLEREGPDLILVNGDRAELLPLVTAAMVFRIPVAHIAGGEITEGAIDDSIRHAVSKLSHLHFPTNQLHADRLRQMGEEPWRIVVTGEPALDAIESLEYLSIGELEDSLGLSLAGNVALVTYHPETLGESGLRAVTCLLEAMDQTPLTYVVTYPNADPGSDEILKALREFCELHPKAILVPSLGQRRYYSMLKVASLMIGNSSSGLWEAPSFGLPVVNIGGRQDGRLRATNVVDVHDVETDAIRRGIESAVSPDFRRSMKGCKNPYWNGGAVDKILEALATVELGTTTLRKKFETDAQE